MYTNSHNSVLPPLSKLRIGRVNRPARMIGATNVITAIQISNFQFCNLSETDKDSHAATGVGHNAPVVKGLLADPERALAAAKIEESRSTKIV